jgi:hypothetical protein
MAQVLPISPPNDILTFLGGFLSRLPPRPTRLTLTPEADL